jgi:hypothetical protein
MQTRQLVVRDAQTADYTELAALDPQFVLVFASIAHAQDPVFVRKLTQAFPSAVIAGCSTAGEISGQGVTNGETCLTAIRFAKTEVQGSTTSIADIHDSVDAGKRLAAGLRPAGLRHVLVFGPGVQVNGSGLIAGMRDVLAQDVTVSGGLAADGGRFAETFTITNDGAATRMAVAVGLYGEHLSLGHGSFHGWVPFGPLRKVTRADGNLLYELDGEPALSVYKRYLGEHARDLPASGLLFPFEVVGSDGARGLIRTILGVDEGEGMLTLAGDIAQGGHVRLMHATTDSLVDGAQSAAEQAGAGSDVVGERLAVLVSCVGRKLVMGARVDEEVEAVADVFGRSCSLTGYYSNGEISPLLESQDCRLHNQTMTITQLAEVA